MRRSKRLEVKYTPIASLKAYSQNPRIHSPKQITQLVNSIKRFGFTHPILTDRSEMIVAGHARFEAAKIIGYKRVPTICLDSLTEAEIRAYVIADNRLAENASWDHQLLAGELQFLSKLDLDFDLSITGFETAEIDLLLQGLDSTETTDAADEIPLIDRAVPPVARVGDLWNLSEHRLLCADATESSSFRRLLGSKKAQMVITDPPYNVSIDGNVCGSGSITHREFSMASGEMSAAEFVMFLGSVFQHLALYSLNGSIHSIFMDWRHLPEVFSAGRRVYTELKNLVVWVKTNAGMGSLYRSQHELILVYKSGTAAHINNIELGRFGRNRSNVWTYPGVNSFREGRLEELAMHPTVKPVALVADAILDLSRRQGVVLDCFGGSGTTIMAAEKTGRRAYVMEIDPLYVDVTIRRFEKLTGAQAVHAQSSLSFAQIECDRRAKVDSFEDQVSS